LLGFGRGEQAFVRILLRLGAAHAALGVAGGRRLPGALCHAGHDQLRQALGAGLVGSDGRG
jgi:hypothetical protein